MAMARFKDLCIDTVGGDTLARFWAAALGLTAVEHEGEWALGGPVAEQRIWLNVVPEPKTVKHRVHLDVNVADVGELLALGATMLEPAEEHGRRWSVLRDPEGGEFCAFARPREELDDYRLHEVVVDSVDPRAITTWWAEVLGCDVGGREDKDWWWLLDVPGLPFGGWDFVPVPEPKTVQNRVHWDVWSDSVEALEQAGATVLRRPDDEIGWTVLADPEGNEFCAFAPPA